MASAAPLRRPPPGRVVINLPTDGTFAASSAALAGAARTPGVATVGVRLKRIGPFADRITGTIPELQMIVGRELQRGHIDDLWTGPAVTAKLLDPATLAETEGKFIRWCRSEEAPQRIRVFDPARLGLLFWAAWALDASARSLEALLGDGLQDALPFLQLNAYGCRLPEHAAFDGFAAKRDDAVWGLIWPPNDWLCACIALPVLATDVDPAIASQPGTPRLGPKTCLRCADWYTRSPRNAMKIHPDRAPI